MTVWLVQPKKGMDDKDTVLASGSITQEILQSLIVASKSTQLHIPFQSGMYSMGESSATVKVQYIPAMSVVKQATPMKILSITPKCGPIRGGQRIVIRGDGFTDGSIEISFTSTDKKSLLGKTPSYTNSKLIEVTAPNCASLRLGDKNWVYISVSCGGKKAKGSRKYKLEQKCQIVRKCLQVDGHGGRCCADPPPPLYGSLDAPETPGGKIGTALLGYRCKP